MKREYIHGLMFVLLSSFSVSNIQAQPSKALTCARPEFQLFQQLVGKWQVEWTDRIAPEKFAESMATAQIENDPTGCILVEHFTGERNGHPFAALILLGFGITEKLQRLLIDSEHGQFISFDGSKYGDVYRFEWQRDLGTRRLQLKHEYRNIQPNSFSTETLLSDDNGQTWNIVQRGLYRRVP